MRYSRETAVRLACLNYYFNSFQSSNLFVLRGEFDKVELIYQRNEGVAVSH